MNLKSYLLSRDMQTESAIRLMRRRVPEYENACTMQKEAERRFCYLLLHQEKITLNTLIVRLVHQGVVRVHELFSSLCSCLCFIFYRSSL